MSTAALDLDLVLDKPGVYDGIPAASYFADPVPGGSLSSTGARLLLQPAGPARFKYALDNPGEEPTDAFDLGTAVHQLALGDPEDRLHVTEADEWRTNAVKAEVAEARAAGKTVLKPKQYATVEAMAMAVRAHPLASTLLKPDSGKPEQTLVWQDKETGVMCRARIDWLSQHVPGRPFIVTDLKTTFAADRDSFGKSSADYGYMTQAAFYLAGVEALQLGPAPTFLFICVEKSAPHLVNVVELDAIAMNLGRNFVRIALLTYAECRRTGHWPGYGEEIESVSLPEWFLSRYDEETEMSL